MTEATLDEFKKYRRAAGDKYIIAAQALHDAFVDLAALDAVVVNGRVGGDPATASFTGDVHTLPNGLVHPEFCRSIGGPNWNDEVRDRLEFYLKRVTQ